MAKSAGSPRVVASPGLPQIPYVRDYRIRLLGIEIRYEMAIGRSG
jgi:hypothetical protein